MLTFTCKFLIRHDQRRRQPNMAGGAGTSLEGPTEAGVRGFLPRKIFEKQDARRCVLMHFGTVKVQLKFSRINAFRVEVLVILLISVYLCGLV